MNSAAKCKKRQSDGLSLYRGSLGQYMAYVWSERRLFIKMKIIVPLLYALYRFHVWASDAGVCQILAVIIEVELIAFHINLHGFRRLFTARACGRRGRGQFDSMFTTDPDGVARGEPACIISDPLFFLIIIFEFNYDEFFLFLIHYSGEKRTRNRDISLMYNDH